MKTNSLLAGPSQEELWAAKLESALAVKESELQLLPGLAAEIFTLRTKTRRLENSVETLGRERRKIVMFP